MKYPNFLIIGAPKAGTTSLYNYLQQHADIQFTKMKEPKYFSFTEKEYNFHGSINLVKRIQNATITNEQDYLSLFRNLHAPFIGEASPNYFHSIVAPEKIYRFNPSMRLIVILRNPVERLYSDWKHNVKIGVEPIKNFRKALKRIERRKKNNALSYYFYLEKGNYASCLKNYMKYFPEHQIKIVFYDDFKKDANKVCNEIIHFLGIDDNFTFHTTRIFMKSNYIPKSKLIRKIANRMGRFSSSFKQNLYDLNEIPPTISKKDKDLVINYYRDEILELQHLTGRDISSWLL